MTDALGDTADLGGLDGIANKGHAESQREQDLDFGPAVPALGDFNGHGPDLACRLCVEGDADTIAIGRQIGGPSLDTFFRGAMGQIMERAKDLCERAVLR